MELIDPVCLEQPHLLGRHNGCDHTAGFCVVFGAIEHMAEPGGNRGTTHGGELGSLCEVGHRHHARHDRGSDPGGEAAGFGLDYALNPTTWIGRGPTVNALGYAKTGLGALDARSAVLDDLDKVTSQALDPYATIRSLYRQHRQSQIDDTRADNRATVPAWFPATGTPSKPGAAVK